MTARVTYHHGDLRQALIESAIDLITEQDVDRLSLREVARRVGVSHAAPYRHFHDKEDLLAAVAEEGFRALTAAMQQGMAQTNDDALDRLEAIGIAYVCFAVTHPCHYRLMFGSVRNEQAPHPERAQAGWQAFQVLVDGIIAAQAAGRVRVGDPKQLAWAAWSMVHGLAMLLLDRCLPVTQPDDVRLLAQFVTQTLTQGLAVHDSAST